MKIVVVQKLNFRIRSEDASSGEDTVESVFEGKITLEIFKGKIVPFNVGQNLFHVLSFLVSYYS